MVFTIWLCYYSCFASGPFNNNLSLVQNYLFEPVFGHLIIIIIIIQIFIKRFFVGVSLWSEALTVHNHPLSSVFVCSLFEFTKVGKQNCLHIVLILLYVLLHSHMHGQSIPKPGTVILK